MTELLDDELEPQHEKPILCNFMDRVRHAYIDFLAIFLITIFLLVVVWPVINSNHSISFIGFIGSVISVYFLYYFVLEFYFKTTLGKLLNKTKVHSIDDEKIGQKEIIIRTIVRLLPISSFSYFVGYERFLHDIFSKTAVVRNQKKK